jgi:hypothetical protein
MSEAGPGTPLLKGCAKFKANSASLSSISRFDGSCLSLGAAAVAAAADDAASHSSSGQAPCSATVSSTDGAAFSAASAVANTIAAAGTGGLELPLTEPALAAATSAAEAAPISHDDAILSHPAVNVDAWVEEQTQQQVGSAAAAADVVALVSAMTADDAVVIIADDDAASDSSAKQQQVVPASNFNSSSSSDGGGKRWWLCMSPDACNNPITWWLGDYDGQHFDIAAADGPHRLDLGTTLYAATLWEDPKVRRTRSGWSWMWCLSVVCCLCPCRCHGRNVPPLAQQACWAVGAWHRTLSTALKAGRTAACECAEVVNDQCAQYII